MWSSSRDASGLPAPSPSRTPGRSESTHTALTNLPDLPIRSACYPTLLIPTCCLSMILPLDGHLWKWGARKIGLPGTPLPNMAFGREESSNHKEQGVHKQARKQLSPVSPAYSVVGIFSRGLECLPCPSLNRGLHPPRWISPGFRAQFPALAQTGNEHPNQRPRFSGWPGRHASAATRD